MAPMAANGRKWPRWPHMAAVSLGDGVRIRLRRLVETCGSTQHERKPLYCSDKTDHLKDAKSARLPVSNGRYFRFPSSLTQRDRSSHHPITLLTTPHDMAADSINLYQSEPFGEDLNPQGDANNSFQPCRHFKDLRVLIGALPARIQEPPAGLHAMMDPWNKPERWIYPSRVGNPESLNAPQVFISLNLSCIWLEEFLTWTEALPSKQSKPRAMLTNQGFCGRPPYNPRAGLSTGQLDLFPGSPWDPVDGMLAGSYLPANPPFTWSFDATNGNDPFAFRADSEPNTNMNKSTSVKGVVATESSESAGNRAILKACPSPGCPFRAKTKRDVDRHHAAVHQKTALFFCEHRGCTRKGGWSRKDSRDRHIKAVHSRQCDSPLRSIARMSTMLSPWSEHSHTRRDASEPELKVPAGTLAESLSREEALRQLYEERRMRLDAENQLQMLRKNYEERDCMLLKVLANKMNLGHE
ncbi:hypothetical protein BKA56DRAFT_620058 [Ilyonectria sp. MPI-CAGE-AT-0026]|nr:hypothetical protein BKA56DRAFT_620058 [Ilyonectria sp. MPI-CAGE-AT-0026]